jgi:hypothetical protein
MSLVVVAATFICIVIVFSEFGGQIRASSAVGWWLAGTLLLVSAIAPKILLPVAHALGVSLVSNFVLAVLILFLYLQLFQMNAMQTRESRRVRDLVTSTAAQSYLARRPEAPLKTAEASALVVVPCYNEEDNVAEMVRRLETLRAGSRWAIEYCFVDDGSLDATPQRLQELAPDRHVRHAANCGVSGALLTGFKIARARGIDYVIQCDGDGQHPVEEIERLVAAAHQDSADVVIASRFLAGGGNALESTTRFRRLGSVVLIGVLTMLWPGLRCTDPTSGFRVFSRRANDYLLRQMPDEFPEPETIALARVGGLRLVEVPLAMHKRVSGVSSITGLRSLVYMYKAVSALIGLRMRSLVRS